MNASHGFEEIPHTADWSLRVWAENLPALFAQAAQGMNKLAGVQIRSGRRSTRAFSHQAGDVESLLVAFLSELVYLQEYEGLGFDDFRIEFEDGSMQASMQGGPLTSVAKPIKAVTFHNLKIVRTAQGYQAQIVFDV